VFILFKGSAVKTMLLKHQAEDRGGPCRTFSCMKYQFKEQKQLEQNNN